MKKCYELQNSRAIEQEKRQFFAARRALSDFRDNKTSSGFPDLKGFLDSRDHKIGSLCLDGWGHRDMGLTGEEFCEFEKAYAESQLS